MLKIGITIFLAVQLAVGVWSTAIAQSVPPPVMLSASELHEFRTKDGTLYDLYVAFPLNYEPDGDIEYPSCRRW